MKDRRYFQGWEDDGIFEGSFHCPRLGSCECCGDGDLLTWLLCAFAVVLRLYLLSCLPLFLIAPVKSRLTHIFFGNRTIWLRGCISYILQLSAPTGEPF